MINDQLTRLERVRLEALSMALRMPVAITPIDDQVHQSDALTLAILRRAEEVERWLLAADGTPSLADS